ncbi:hypothetical protein [Raineya orbicola]|nr:hypothetical protein [Raineya orbicola]
MQKTIFFVTFSLFTTICVFAQTEREVTITQWSAKEEEGYIKVYGEVKNTYPNALGFVKIEIEYYDKAGKPLGVDRFTARDAGTMAKDETSAELDVILPGEISPFQRIRDVNKIKGQFGSCKIKATGLLFKENVPIAASLSDLSITPQGKNFVVKGTYKATGKEACKNPAIIITGYDKAGKVVQVNKYNFTVGTDKYNFVKSLAVGESYNFSTNFNTSGNVSQVKVFPFFSGYF